MRKYFITGALVLVPLAITAWVLNFVISTLDQSLVLVPERLAAAHATSRAWAPSSRWPSCS